MGNPGGLKHGEPVTKMAVAVVAEEYFQYSLLLKKSNKTIRVIE